MKMKYLSYGMCGLLFALLVGGSVLAQEDAGGIPVRVESVDGLPSKCIDASKDRVWFTLRRLVTTKKAGWFKKDNSVQVIINAQVRTDPAKALSFPLTTQVKFGDVPTGQVSVPIEYPIVAGLQLTQGEVVYTGIGVEITLLNMQDPSKLGSAIQALSTITSSSKLPIPASPYLQGATYLLDFANTAIKNDIEANNKNDKLKSGALSFNFDPDGQCSGDFEKTGTKAIVYSTGPTTTSPTNDSFIDVNHTDSYCWSADLTPTFILKAAKKDSGTSCQDPRYAQRYKAITNNYIAFFLNKRTTSKKLGPDSTSEKDKNESLQRCQLNGIVAASCPGASD
jgi:hypothetical protein